MHFQPDEDQQAFLEGLGRLVDDMGGGALVRKGLATRSGVDDELWTLLGDVGVLGIAAEERWGGQGAGWLDACLCAEVLGMWLIDGPVLFHQLAVAAIDRFADETAKERWLPGLCAGSQRATFSIDERDGADVLRSVPFADGADVVVYAGNEGALLLETAGSEIVPAQPLDASWRLADVSAEEAAKRPFENGNVTRLLGNMAHAAMACAQTGLAERCLQMSVSYAIDRKQFGVPIGSFQAVQHHCADMLVQVELARSAAWYAAWTIDNDKGERDEAAVIASQVCGDAAFFNAGTAIQVHGGIGFTWEHDCHLLFKRAETTRRLFRDRTSIPARLRAAAGVATSL